MKNRFCFKKTLMAVSAAAFLVAGVPGISTVTAWALPSEGTVEAEGINVRASAVDGEVIDTLSAGKEVAIVDSTVGSDGETWYEVSYSSSGMDLAGWVRADLLSTTGDEEEIEEELEEDIEAAEENEEEAVEEAKEETEEPVAASSGSITYVIASSIPADVVPDGFQKTTVDYEGEDVPALVMNNAEVYLLYMEDASNTAPGRLVVYDMDKAELIPYISFETNDGFILLLNIPDAELESVSDRFASTTCEFESGTMDALQMVQEDAIISESADIADFYYMYGVDRDGMYGWYVYDDKEGTIQKNILNMHYNLNGTSVVAEEEESGFSLDSLSLIVIVGIIVIFLLLLILVIIFGVRYRQLANEMDEMDQANGKGSGGGSGGRRKKAVAEEYYDDDDDLYLDDDPGYSRRSRKASSRAAESKVSQDTLNFDDSAPKGSTAGGTSADPLKKAQSVQQPQKPQQPQPQQPPKSSRTKTSPDDDPDDLQFL